MLRSVTLDDISNKCNIFFKEKNIQYNPSEVILFIENELSNDVFTWKSNFADFQNAFNKTIDKTPNKDKFVQIEIDSVKEIIGAALKGIPDEEKIYETIYKCVLIGNDKLKVFEHFYHKHIQKDIEEMNYNTLVRIAYTYDLIKYLCFLEGGALKRTPPQQTEKITLPQVALMLYYNGQVVTRENGNEIAKQHGFTSGEALFQDFSKYSSRQNRIGREETKRKNQNKLTLFERVISKLTAEPKQRATDEMNTLKAAIEKDEL